MTREELLARIWIDPKRCFGKPCIRGHRIWVSLILDLLASGMTSDEILADYPGLESADILACIAYGSEMSREHRRGENAFDLARRLGIVGSAKGLPRDLSTNPKHIEGFGVG